MPDNPGHTPGTQWAMRVDFSESVSGPSIKPGLGAAVGILEIRNLDSGEIGTYGMASLDVGFGIGLGVRPSAWDTPTTTRNPAGSWRGRLPGGPEQLRRPTGS